MKREIVSFLDDDSPMGCEWGYLIQRHRDGSGIVEWRGKRRRVDMLLAPFPVPSTNLIIPYKLDSYTLAIEKELLG